MLSECLARLSHPSMEYFRDTYKNSERWNGIDSLDGKTIIVYCEQGYGDTIQFARYFPYFKNCTVILHCPVPLHKLLASFGFQMLDRNNPELPSHDYHVLSMSLPFCFENKWDYPYLKIEEKIDLGDMQLKEDVIKVGIKWEGNPDHSNNAIRCCPLSYFRDLAQQFPKLKFFALHNVFHNLDYLDGCDEMELYASESQDFYDTAKLINAMDFVISTDTSVLHLSGALGKKTYGLLSKQCDGRWNLEEINWYPSIQFIRQEVENDWDTVFETLKEELERNYVSR